MGSYVVVLVRENDHFTLCINLSSKAKMKEANAERMPRHPQDSAALRSPMVSAPHVLLLLSKNMTVEVTKMSPAQPPPLPLNPRRPCAYYCLVMSLQTWCVLVPRGHPLSFRACSFPLGASWYSLLKASESPLRTQISFQASSLCLPFPS